MSLDGIEAVRAIYSSYDPNELIKFNAILQALVDGDSAEAKRLESALTSHEKINFGIYKLNNERISAFEETLPPGQTVIQLLLATTAPKPAPILIAHPKSATDGPAETAPENPSNDIHKTGRKPWK